MRPKPSEFTLGVEASYEVLEVTERCLLCPEWVFVGTVVEGRAAAFEHRRREHPKLARIKRRTSRNLRSFRQRKLRPDEEAELDAERQKRAWLIGLEIAE